MREGVPQGISGNRTSSGRRNPNQRIHASVHLTAAVIGIFEAVRYRPGQFTHHLALLSPAFAASIFMIVNALHGQIGPRARFVIDRRRRHDKWGSFLGLHIALDQSFKLRSRKILTRCQLPIIDGR